mgnify:FL=1
MNQQEVDAIAHTLDANEAPLALVLDFADMLEESVNDFSRKAFVRSATLRLDKSLATDIRMLLRATKGR